MRQDTVVWAYSDMDAARRLWPRVKALIERQVQDGELDLSLGEQRRLIAAVVNDLLEEEKQEIKQFRSRPKQISRLMRLFKKSGTALPEQQSA